MQTTARTRDETAPTVFVIDDEVNVRCALARLIHSLGMHVKTFASAREFLRCQRPDGPSCLVLDVRIADENGLIVQEALRTATWRLPIIFITGHGTVPMCARAMKGGAVDFLQKPVDDEDLLAAISIALEQDSRTRDSQHQHDELHQRIATLTPRQREVLRLLTTGLRNKEIAYALGTSERTIKAHRACIMQKMQATSVAELVRMTTMEAMGEPHIAANT